MEDTDTEFFEISAVARLTGISSHVLRVWERRYEVVKPHRSETKRRKYSQSDIQRLSLLKTLVDNGHSIGTIAKLSRSQLEERLSNVLESKAGEDGIEAFAPAGVCRICLVGTIIRQAVREATDATPALTIVGEFMQLDEVARCLQPKAADLLIIEREALFPEDIKEIQEIVSTQGIRRAIVVYRFAQENVIQPLDIKKITALRAPVDSSEIQLACIADIQLALRSGAKAELSNTDEEKKPFQRPHADDLPPRAFSDEQLVQVANISSVVKCECPQHLASLLSSLAAFETYSEQCEDRSPEDAKLHAFLHRTTANCRSQMEVALSEVLTEEGITI